MRVLKIAGIIFVGLIAIAIIRAAFVHYRFNFKPMVNFIVSYSLSRPCNGAKDCTEMRPLPKYLQGKKIVFSSGANILFEPFWSESEISAEDLDTIGYIDLDASSIPETKTIVSPNSNKRGYLTEREYKIIRAMYHYKCLFCIDSSDYSEIILEDINGNRFSSGLNGYDMGVSPSRERSWDEYTPYYLESDKYGKEISEVKLLDI